MQSVDPNLLDTLAGRLQRGRFLNAATARYPAVVLGAVAAQRLGIDRTGVLVYLGGHWFTVAGILQPLELAPDLDAAALIGLPVAQQLFGASDSPATIYVRATPQSIEDVSSVLPATANPQNPEEVQVSRPSDALQARSAVNTSYTALFLGLGAVALLVGGIGIANMMVISVLERRSEIGLRRALGATKRHIWGQFLTESALLGFFGGLAGLGIGVLVTAALRLVARLGDRRAELRPLRRARRRAPDRRARGTLSGGARGAHVADRGAPHRVAPVSGTARAAASRSRAERTCGRSGTSRGRSRPRP